MKATALYLLFAATIFAACVHTDKPTASQRAAAQKIAGQYAGVTPCADCEGIEYLLNIQADFTYLGAVIYRGKSDRPFPRSGKWAFTADNKIKLEVASPNENLLFEIAENQLIMLDAQGQRITGELADRYILWKDGFAPPPQPGGDGDAFETHRKAGVDFLGLGTEPFWALEIDFDKNMLFTTADGDSLTAPAVPGRIQDGALHYETNTGALELKIALRRETCSDGMSDREYDYSVEANVKGRAYKGCGVLLAGSLGSYWTLQSLNGAEPDGKAFARGLPVLQMTPSTKKYSGSDGCNQLNGAFTRDGSKIKFEQPASTRMACPGDAPKQYLDALLSVTAYKIEGTELTLLAGGKAVLVYGLSW